MMTLFSVPCAFEGHRNIIQRNALNTWVRLRWQPRIILLGNDAGVAEAAKEFGCVHVPDVEVSPRGRPVLSDVFARAGKMATDGVMCWTNADMMLVHLSEAALRCSRGLNEFLMVGQRSDVDIVEEWDFSPGWEGRLGDYALRTGKVHSAGAMDYFVFRDGLFREMPPFYVGIPMWDNYALSHAAGRVPIVDATSVVMAIHQEHGREARLGYESRSSHQEEWGEFQHNEKLFGEYCKFPRSKISDATWVLDDEELCEVCHMERR